MKMKKMRYNPNKQQQWRAHKKASIRRIDVIDEVVKDRLEAEEE
jgi:hypothetical protein